MPLNGIKQIPKIHNCHPSKNSDGTDGMIIKGTLIPSANINNHTTYDMDNEKVLCGCWELQTALDPFWWFWQDNINIKIQNIKDWMTKNITIL